MESAVIDEVKSRLGSSAVLWAWLVVVAGLPGQAEVTITEFMAANAKTLADEDGDYSDWVELYNAGGGAVNLQGWSLTDSTNLLAQWVFPSTNLAPNGFLVVFLSGKDRAVPGKRLHANFSLNADGEYLALLGPEGDQVVSEFAPVFPPQFPDISYGVYLGRRYYFTKPTPGAPNGTGFENYVADTKFDHDRGFYDQPFTLTITTATAGATIRYTTNGTPPSLTNGVVYTNAILISGTTVLRAGAFKDGALPSGTDTQTYVFLDDVIRQAPTGQPPPGWPASWGANVRDYGMDPEVVTNTRFSGTIKADLKTIPSFSLVMDLKDLFNASTGIYANAGQDGRTWERRGSLELIYPDARKGFQADAGVRIRGGYSRSTGNPKHAFRFFFRGEYGMPRLRFPVVGPEGADSFDGFDLRCAQNYSWSFEGDTRGVFLRDQFSRDSQLAMGWAAERGDFYHLYINGQYWGLYNTAERPEASYGASYFGGNKEDYDVIKVAPDNSYTIIATDGNLNAWQRLYNICKAGVTNDAVYQKLQGNNPDGARNPAYEVLLEMPSLIDYMLVILYGGNLDAPISNFLGNNNPNNWYGLRNRLGVEGFRFFAHDSEHTLLNVSEDRTGPFPAGNSSVVYSSPQWVWQKLWANTEFKVLVGDRVHRHCFNAGVLTPETSLARFMKRKNEIDRAVVGESARWGDSKRNPPLTRDTWVSAVGSITNGFFPRRTGILLDQLKRKGLYPNVVAPVFTPHGGSFGAGFKLLMTNVSGAILYTLDGSDPRLRGGTVAPGARAYQGPVPLGESAVVKARVLDGTNWSALNEAAFTMAQTFTNLLITELMYHPKADGLVSGDEFEFVELKNANSFEVDASGVYFTNGVHYVFPLGTRLAPGQFVVLVNNPATFAQRYPAVRADGVYRGSLDNGGERITLVHAVGTPLFSVTYSDAPPWPALADGQGFSLVPVSPDTNPEPNNPAQWRASSRLGGSPGADDPAADIGQVVINEVRLRGEGPLPSAVELLSLATNDLAIGGWFLSDDRTAPKKYRFPPGNVLRPGEFRVLDEGDFNPDPGTPLSFTLGPGAGQVFLHSADEAGNLSGYSDGFAFEAAAEGVTFGRYMNSVGEVQDPAQREASLGGPNTGPRVGPVVFNEVQYQPAAGEAEFIELKNLTSEPVPLYDPAAPTNTWRITGISFDFPTNVELAPHGLALVVGGDAAAFRARYRVPAKVPVFVPYQGTLQDGGELLRLQRPGPPRADPKGAVASYITVDELRYAARAPWPAAAAGQGPSLERVRADAYGNDPDNWRASLGLPSPGLENDGNRAPVADAGADLELQAISFPVSLTLAGDGRDDGLPNPPKTLTPTWRQVGGPGPVVIRNPQAWRPVVSLPGLGAYLFRLTVDDGELQAEDEVAVTLTRPPSQFTLIPTGALWKYLDTGADQGGAWRSLAFADATWPAGKAQLGYGDGDETTLLSFGPDANNKYVTTYFRNVFSVTNAAAVTGLTLKVLRDDGVAAYLNGTEVFRDNLPEGNLNFRTYANSAIGGADESTFYEKEVSPALLREGPNLLAAELHQANATSTDISFDFELDALAFSGNQPPQARAGGALTLTLPAQAVLDGSFADDGLPFPPGVVAAQWSKIDGPGAVSFVAPDHLDTGASFSAAGVYHLRLTINDGAASASDDLTVTVRDAAPALRVSAVEIAALSPPVVRFRFAPAIGQAYVVQYREAFGRGQWETLVEVPAQTSDAPVEVADPLTPDHRERYYRILQQ